MGCEKCEYPALEVREHNLLCPKCGHIQSPTKVPSYEEQIKELQAEIQRLHQILNKYNINYR